MNNSDCQPEQEMVSRRDFLRLSSASIVALSIPGFLRRPGIPKTLFAQRAQYPRQRIAKLSELVAREPLRFRYPWDHPAAGNILIMLDEPAGGAVGPEANVVAFNSFCTHQGGPLEGQFHGNLGVVGPCPLHWTTFDLTRHGMVISGHATLGLPQIILELEGDEIFASAVQGLIFSYSNNLVDPTGEGA